MQSQPAACVFASVPARDKHMVASAAAQRPRRDILKLTSATRACRLAVAWTCTFLLKFFFRHPTLALQAVSLCPPSLPSCSHGSTSPLFPVQ